MDRSPVTLAATAHWDQEQGLFQFRAFGNQGIAAIALSKEGALSILNKTEASNTQCLKMLGELRELVEGRVNTYIREGRLPNESGIFFLSEADLTGRVDEPTDI